jgi:hypothetical protein
MAFAPVGEDGPSQPGQPVEQRPISDFGFRDKETFKTRPQDKNIRLNNMVGENQRS